MTITLGIVLAVLFYLLLLVASMRPLRSDMSLAELRRRGEKGDEQARAMIKREEVGDDIQTVLKIATALLLVVFVLLSVAWFGWLVGNVLAVVAVLEYGALARTKPIRQGGEWVYGRIEPYLMQFVQIGSGVLKFVRFQSDVQVRRRVHSKEELVELVQDSKNILRDDELKRLVNGLEFGDKHVSQVMTPRSVIDTVAHNELLGPLTLDILYKTGHSRLPVIDGDIDHIVGILYVQDLLVATSKKTPTAADVMESKVFYIREDQSLQHALSAFLKTHHHLFVVVNEYRETVGVVSLEDVIEALLGQKIIDEFDAHDDLRKVAERNPRGNNKPVARTDV